MKEARSFDNFQSFSIAWIFYQGGGFPILERANSDLTQTKPEKTADILRRHQKTAARKTTGFPAKWILEWMFAAVPDPRTWSFRGEAIGGVLKCRLQACQNTDVHFWSLLKTKNKPKKKKTEFSLRSKRFEIPREWYKTREEEGRGGEKKPSIEREAWDEVAKQLSKMAAHKSAFQRLLCLSMPSLGKCNFFYFHILYVVWLFRIFHVFRCQLFWFVDVALLYKSLMTGETGHGIFH